MAKATARGRTKSTTTPAVSSEAIVASYNDEAIRSRIFTIRGVQVMLDRDLAMLYGVSTSRLNEQVKRNIRRFPENFMFQISDDELAVWRKWMSQNAMSNISGTLKMGVRRRPYAFTEHGIIMLASVLR